MTPGLPCDGVKTLLIRNAACVATFDDARREWRDASAFVRGHRIAAIGPAADVPQSADAVVDARDRLVVHDPVASLLQCASAQAAATVVDGVGACARAGSRPSTWGRWWSATTRCRGNSPRPEVERRRQATIEDDTGRLEAT